MKIINIQNGNDVQQLSYDYESGVYTFENDIVMGEWKVGRIILIGGPESSIYKHDFRNYFEFVLTDCTGESHPLRWHFNGGDEVLDAYWGDNAAESLPHFFATHPVFTAKDWNDYAEKARKIRLAIKEF